jgi:RNA polymerase sigma-70 factor (ECF subfamily)
MPVPLSTDAVATAHRGFVRRVLAARGVAADDVDDMIQEVFVVLCRRGALFETPAAARAWLFQTARRVASSHRRSVARTSRARALTGAEPGAIASPEVWCQHREAAVALERFVHALPPADRAVFELSAYEGASGPEVARRLGLCLNTTYAKIRRLRRRWARALVVALLVALALALVLVGGGCSTHRSPTPGDAIAEAPDEPPVLVAAHPGG